MTTFEQKLKDYQEGQRETAQRQSWEHRLEMPSEQMIKKDPIQIMKDYLLLKFEQGDYHGVADAAMDLREMLAKENK